MTATELTAEILIFETAIRNIALTGQEYEVGSGPSKRVFKAADIDKLRSYVNDLKRQLAAENCDDGLYVGF